MLSEDDLALSGPADDSITFPTEDMTASVKDIAIGILKSVVGYNLGNPDVDLLTGAFNPNLEDISDSSVMQAFYWLGHRVAHSF
jgi:hypothetical protein